MVFTRTTQEPEHLGDQSPMDTTTTPAAPFWGDPNCPSCRTHRGGCSDHQGPEYRSQAATTQDDREARRREYTALVRYTAHRMRTAVEEPTVANVARYAKGTPADTWSDA